MRNVTCICGDCEPKCEAQWLFNGNRSGYASLELNNVSRFDAGIYKCACMNPTTLKEANTDIEIVVECAYYYLLVLQIYLKVIYIH